MTQYRKKPVVINAIQFVDTAERLSQLSDFIDNQDLVVDYSGEKIATLKITTL
jgi:hypothetical protein